MAVRPLLKPHKLQSQQGWRHLHTLKFRLDCGRSLKQPLHLYRFGPYFVSPVIAGLEKDLTPYLAGTDSIGAIETAKDFMVAGTAPDSLLGMCESMWRPDMVRLFDDPQSSVR